MLKNFLLIWLDGDEARADEIISENDWVEMTASRLREVLEKYAAQQSVQRTECPRCVGKGYFMIGSDECKCPDCNGTGIRR